ncbi:hypothetical protein PENFLA_c026G04783 [Penicillium flavigenum]|uniref:Uncharacterized protein n=1 Tax=Penicillium flavigenum TaxID=254877 RepID=A0A1V6SS32_9EURO|nr:hypothetical protein PENFLA_c026G04783 [Penicillium flavigenum]
MSNVTLYCQCQPPPSQQDKCWEAPLIGGGFGLLGLILVLGFLFWVYKFRGRQALLAHPQRVMTHEYLQRKEEEQRPWWRFRVSASSPWRPRGASGPTENHHLPPPEDNTGDSAAAKKRQREEEARKKKKKEEEGDGKEAGKNKNRLTILCDSAESASGGEYLLQGVDADSIPLEFVGPPPGHSLSAQVATDNDLLPDIKGKGKG